MSDLINKILLLRNSDGEWLDERGVVNVKAQIAAEIALVREHDRSPVYDAICEIQYAERQRCIDAAKKERIQGKAYSEFEDGYDAAIENVIKALEAQK